VLKQKGAADCGGPASGDGTASRMLAMLHVTDITDLQAGGASRTSGGPAPRERPNKAISSASQPETPSELEEYCDLDTSLQLLTEWTGRPAVSPTHFAYAFVIRTPIWSPDQRVNPLSPVLDKQLVRSQQHCPRLVLPQSSSHVAAENNLSIVQDSSRPKRSTHTSGPLGGRK
jgi:hypothetical protein